MCIYNRKGISHKIETRMVHDCMLLKEEKPELNHSAGLKQKMGIAVQRKNLHRSCQSGQDRAAWLQLYTHSRAAWQHESMKSSTPWGV